MASAALAETIHGGLIGWVAGDGVRLGELPYGRPADNEGECHGDSSGFTLYINEPSCIMHRLNFNLGF
jgi:hypothetical protein